MTHAPASPRDEGHSDWASRLEEALAALAQALAILDALELPSIATHVSYAHELAKAQRASLHKSGGSQPEEAGIN